MLVLGIQTSSVLAVVDGGNDENSDGHEENENDGSDEDDISIDNLAYRVGVLY